MGYISSMKSEGISYLRTGAYITFSFISRKAAKTAKKTNPFNPVTEIRYQLPEEAEVRLVVYDLLGQEVRILRERVHQAGYYAMRWDGRDSLERNVGSGVYVVRMQVGDFVEAKTMVLMR